VRSPITHVKYLANNRVEPNVTTKTLFLGTILIGALCFVALGDLPSQNKDSANNNLVVKTKNGQVQGITRRDGGAEFLGIPYAAPPVGDLRWREPQPVKPWQGVREASSFGAPCAQAVLGDWNRRDSETSSEDCLFLNVITPKLQTDKPLPVMFWIHGGANAGGTASSELYKDGTLVQHGVLLVTINYRLGVFGFFAHSELTRESAHHASGNYGLLDQIAALRWVRENISAFGGDPNNVTVFGQSAGAQDTSMLMTSPLAHGLFHKAIAQSGAVINPLIPNLKDAEVNGEKIAQGLKAPSGDGGLKYLRGLSVKEVLGGTAKQNPVAPPVFGPIVDGWVLPRSGAAVFAEGKQAAIPLMIGVTAREFTLNGGIEAARQMITAFSGSLAPRVLASYGLADGGAGKPDPLYGPPENQWFSDLLFRCPTTTQAQWQVAIKQPTYQYQFERAIPGQEAAIHSSDLPYVFGYYPKTGNISGSFNAVDFKLADMIETYWTNFAKTGNPNGGSTTWPAVGDSDSFIRFTVDGKVEVGSQLRKPQCDLLREVLKIQMSKK
jgi:para-nitrobenzyl esterase